MTCLWTPRHTSTSSEWIPPWALPPVSPIKYSMPLPPLFLSTVWIERMLKERWPTICAHVYNFPWKHSCPSLVVPHTFIVVNSPLTGCLFKNTSQWAKHDGSLHQQALCLIVPSYSPGQPLCQLKPTSICCSSSNTWRKQHTSLCMYITCKIMRGNNVYFALLGNV